jgi:hypothetical protein
MESNSYGGGTPVFGWHEELSASIASEREIYMSRRKRRMDIKRRKYWREFWFSLLVFIKSKL